jgi:hypothetical protein
MKLTKKARKAIKKGRHRLKLSVTVSLTSPGATAVKKTLRVTVKAPAGKKT